MRYVSPAWLFNGRLPRRFDLKAIRLRRTQLLADLELTGITIDYHGEVLTKNDIIHLFDELATENALAWHQAIAQDKVLLTFLEDIHFDDWAVNQHCVNYLDNPLYQDEAFLKWISPYYYDSFLFYMEMNCLKTSNFHALVALLGVPLLMTPDDEEKAWQATRSLLDELTSVWMENAIQLAYSQQVRTRLEGRRRKTYLPGETIPGIGNIPPHVWGIIVAALILCYWLGHPFH